MTNRDMFLAMLDERIRLASSSMTHGGYVALKVQFELLFPSYVIDVLPYNHESDELDKSAGYDLKELQEHPLLRKFNKDFYTLIEKAYKDKEPIPKLSRLLEMLEDLNIHPRLMMISAYGLQISYSKFQKNFSERDMYHEIRKHAEGDDPDKLLDYLNKLKEKNKPTSDGN